MPRRLISVATGTAFGAGAALLALGTCSRLALWQGAAPGPLEPAAAGVLALALVPLGARLRSTVAFGLFTALGAVTSLLGEALFCRGLPPDTGTVLWLLLLPALCMGCAWGALLPVLGTARTLVLPALGAALAVTIGVEAAATWTGVQRLGAGLLLLAAVLGHLLPAPGRHSRFLPFAAAALLLFAAPVACWALVPVAPPAGVSVLARVGKAAVVFDRTTQRLALIGPEGLRDRWGPEVPDHALLADAPFLLRDRLRRVAVLGTGSGRTWTALTDHGVEERFSVGPSLAAGLGRACRADGAVLPAPRPGGSTGSFPTVPGGATAFLARRPKGSLDLVTWAGTAAPPWTFGRPFQTLARRALGPDGVYAQLLDPQLLGGSRLAALLDTAAAAHPRVAVYLFGDRLLLLAHGGPPVTAAAAGSRLAALPPPARARLHRAGLATGDDLIHGRLLSRWRPRGPSVGPADHRRPPPPGPVGAVWSLLAAAADGALSEDRLAVRGAPDPGVLERLAGYSAAPGSVLLWREDLDGRAVLAEHAVRNGRLHRAARWVGRPHRRGVLVAAQKGLAAAVAVDPSCLLHLPAPDGFAPLLPLADVARLPAGDTLRTWAAADDDRGLALRHRRPHHCAAAFLEALAKAPLSDHHARALRAVLDPAHLLAAAARVAARDGGIAAEILPLWRTDLPVVPAVAALLDEPPGTRTALATALGGRRQARARDLLATLLLDGAIQVRRAAAASLFRTVGPSIPYDPLGSEESRVRAARALRTLPPRTP